MEYGKHTVRLVANPPSLLLLILVVMMKSKELKAKISHAHSLISLLLLSPDSMIPTSVLELEGARSDWQELHGLEPVFAGHSSHRH